MADWIPVNNPAPPDDFHTWAKPAPDACPLCRCCSRRLCEQAIAEDSACHLLGTSADFDLSRCPCWRNQPGHTPVPDAATPTTPPDPTSRTA